MSDYIELKVRIDKKKLEELLSKQLEEQIPTILANSIGSQLAEKLLQALKKNMGQNKEK